MVEWAREQVSADTPRETTDQLLRALVDSDGFGLQYSPNFTGTAVDVFATRRANCLAFTHLFVGLTRALGVGTFYVNWNLVEGYHREEDIVVISGHVSAGQGRLNDLYVLQFGAVEGLEVRGVLPISDINALARHYANRTSELLRDRDLEAALEAGELATRIDPALDDAWVNLGVARRRAGDLDGAAAAYDEATRIDPDNLAAYRNLRVLLRIRGEQDAADQILKLLERRGSRNPYLYLELGDESIAAGFVDEAGPYYRRANNLGPKLAETRAARGLWFLAIGTRETARKWLRKARAIDADEERTRKLANRLDARTEDSS